jgi:hypothetical protein
MAAAREEAVMVEWSVHMAAASGDDFGEPEADAIIDALAPYAPAVSYGRGGLTARVTVEARSAGEAVDRALEVFGKACPALDVFRVEAQTVEGLEQDLGTTNIPELIGIAELATLLGVSKQRASELARGTDFPAPLAVLVAGPVWPLANVLRYVRAWKRRPGRPRKVARPPTRTSTVHDRQHDIH